MGYDDQRAVGSAGSGVRGRAFLLGWCTELLQGAFLIADDIMDEAETRRGKTAWYKMKKVGVDARCLPAGGHDEHQ